MKIKGVDASKLTKRQQTALKNILSIIQKHIQYMVTL